MEPSDVLRKLGRQEYKRKNYHGALNFFNSAISHEKVPAIEALDNRAATYEKLGDLHAALKDGRRMVSEYKSSCVGYLRTGKVLRLLGKEETALGIYKYGIRNVPPGDPTFQLLNQMYDETRRACGPRKARDPLTLLPTEVAQMILTYFDFREIVSIVRVSTQWRDYLTSMPGLWTKLDFSAAKAKIPGTAIQKYLQYSRAGDLKHLSITHCTTLRELELTEMVSRGYMDKLSYLDLSHTHVTDNVIEPLVLRARHLRKVRLAATKITGISVKALVTRPGIELVHLDVTDCNNISADAKTLARKKLGLKVLSGMSEFSGKKIRFE
ncbi:MAG: hypothetical protein Q9207_003853 [Kuettlingeria erythrocarpa]